MLAKFRDRYPQGSLVSKLVDIDRGIYIVRVSIKVDTTTLVTALAGANTVEAAEDAARNRAIATLFLDSSTQKQNSSAATAMAAPKINPTPPNLTSPEINRDAADNIVNFSKPNPEIAAPKVPSLAPETSISVPTIEPEVKSPTPAPATNTSNLFAGTSSVAEDTTELNLVPDLETQSETVAAEPEATAPEMTDFDFTTVKQKTDIEIERLGWTRDDGREFLQSRYGKRSRLHLKDEELLEFLRYLEKQPTPVN